MSQNITGKNADVLLREMERGVVFAEVAVCVLCFQVCFVFVVFIVNTHFMPLNENKFRV